MSGRKIPWPGGPSIKQNFSLPSSIIYYMAMNPSTPEVYNKLIECCKYFFEENPILVVNRLEHFYDEKDKMNIYSKRRHRNDKFHVSINLKKIASRFWLTGNLSIDENNVSNTSTLCSKLFRCDIVHLGLFEKTVMFEDFKLLINSVRSISLANVKMLNNDGSVVNLEKIIDSVPNVQEFSYINFYDVNGIYKIGELSNFIKNHENLPIELIVFYSDVSAEYKTELDELIDTVIESGISNRRIAYEGQDAEKYNILKNRFTFKSDVMIDNEEENVDENANGVALFYEFADNSDSEDEEITDDEEDDIFDSEDDEKSDDESEDVSVDDYEDE